LFLISSAIFRVSSIFPKSYYVPIPFHLTGSERCHYLSLIPGSRKVCCRHWSVDLNSAEIIEYLMSSSRIWRCDSMGHSNLEICTCSEISYNPRDSSHVYTTCLWLYFEEGDRHYLLLGSQAGFSPALYTIVRQMYAFVTFVFSLPYYFLFFFFSNLSKS
jgi:hypothetical protein